MRERLVMGIKVKFKSNCKINLFLDIAGKRNDGFHNIITLFQEISLSDMITIKERKGGGIRVSSGIKSICGEKNIAYRIAGYIIEKFGIKQGVDIHIEKNVPLGAGLGGGSSNGTAVLKALNGLWKLGMDENELILTASLFGSDTAFFIHGGTALGEGRGELLSRLRLSGRRHIVVTYPGIFISTKEVYASASFYLTKKNKRDIIQKIKASVSSGRIEDVVFNRLEKVVFPKYPLVEKIRLFFSSQGLTSAMSGSGSSVFGLAGSRKEGLSAVREFKKKYNFPVWLTETV